MRVLVLTHRLPYAPNRGDRVRAHHIIKAIAERATVDIVSLVHSGAEAAEARGLANLCDRVVAVRVPQVRNYGRALASLPTRAALTHVLLDAPGIRPALRAVTAANPPDVVLAYCSGMARFAVEEPLCGSPFVLDMVDVDSAKWSALAETAGPVKRWVYSREARRLAAFEAAVARQALVTYVVNDRERQILTTLAPGARVKVLPNGVDVASLAPMVPPRASQDVVFCGVMNYEPNEQAALWLIREVWPLVQREIPAATLSVVGSDPTHAIVNAASRNAGIAVTGTVPDVRPFLWNGAVAVAPLLVARGVQNKVLEAVAAGLPAVVTPAVADGLPREILPACLVGGHARAMAAQIIGILKRTPGERRAIAARADLTRLTWAQRLAPLVSALESAAATRTRIVSETRTHDTSPSIAPVHAY